MSQVTTAEWRPMQSGNLGRVATFRRDGTYTILGMECDQNTSFRNTLLGDAKVEKRAGTGEVLSIVAPHTTHLLRYGDDGQWWHQGEVKKGFFARLFGL